MALGVKVCEAGQWVLYRTIEELLTSLKRALTERRLTQTLQQPTYPKVSGVGRNRLPMTWEEASLFFGISGGAARGPPGSSPRAGASSDWGEISGDQVLATAILDRLLHCVATLNIQGENCRPK